MIRTLDGQVTHLLPDGVVVGVGGVGYLVVVPARSVPPVGETVSYFVYHHVREDGQALYGFATLAELERFEQLLTVPSIGPKLAMAILSAATPDEIARAVETDNLAFFSSLSGVGKKSAAKIIVELKGRITASREVVVPTGGTDLAEALTTLGYAPAEIQSVLKSLPTDLDLQQQVSWALKALAR